METKYFIFMYVGGNPAGYVATAQDIENNGHTDINPDDFSFATREEAEATASELRGYCETKGYVNITLVVEHFWGTKKTTMQEIANYYNSCESLDVQELEQKIKEAGFVSDCGTVWGVCHNDTQKVIIDDNGMATVVNIKKDKEL